MVFIFYKENAQVLANKKFSLNNELKGIHQIY